jgi:predicted DNA-binding transcriptional regulator AlpA
VSTSNTETLPELATRRQVADFLQISVGALARWAMEGKGPRYVRFGGSGATLRYRRDDVLAWIESYGESA